MKPADGVSWSTNTVTKSITETTSVEIFPAFNVSIVTKFRRLHQRAIMCCRTVGFGTAVGSNIGRRIGLIAALFCIMLCDSI